MSRLSLGQPSRKVLPVLFALVLLAASCGATEQGATAGHAAPSQSPSADEAPPPAALDKASAFAAEEALGAECSRSWIGEPPMQDANCYGMLPAHVADFLQVIPDSHLHLDAEYLEQQAAKKQQFVFVEGYGKRQDVLARVTERPSAFWIRSFEGPEPDVTVYVVYGPGCNDDPLFQERFIGDGCLPGYPYVMRDIRIYRVRAGGIPEDVTTELAPPPPVLTAEERKRYGIYLRPPEEGDAENSDLGLEVRRLATSPVMRWVINPAEEGDYEKPRIPDSDLRGFHGQAHFGFLVWTGKRFELREKISSTLWACGVRGVGDGSCLVGFSGRGDPYLIPDHAPADGAGDAP